MNRKIFRNMFMIILSMILLVGCSTTNENNKDDNKLTIVTSFYPIYLHTINVTKNIPGVEVINMTEPQVGCLHDYQLSPNDLKTLDLGDIFIINGGGMESFLDKVIEQMPELTVIDSSSGIELLEEHSHSQNKDEHDHEHDFNPHVWVSISGAISQVDNIATELSRLDETNKEQYIKNATDYKIKLETLKTKMHDSLDNLPNRNIVTFHEAFPYFAKEFDLNIVGTILSDEGVEPSAKEISKIIEDIKQQNVVAIFIEPQYASKSASVISKESGVNVYTLDPIVTGEAKISNMDDYIIRMEKNLKELEEAFK